MRILTLLGIDAQIGEPQKTNKNKTEKKEIKMYLRQQVNKIAQA